MADDQLPGFEPVSDTVAKLRERIEINEQRKTLTAAQRKLLDQSAAIFGEPATKQDAAYLPRELVQVTLPHKNPGDIPVWTRSNGNLTVGIQPGMNVTTRESYGYPYGTVPRLLMISPPGVPRPSGRGALPCRLKPP